jgi:16S rRNA (guanine966-N2)-methyltransferase
VAHRQRRTHRPANTLRIIGGTWRGRRLGFADAPGLRPTPDRVRETLFNWLAPWLPGSRCLDLFAGSGALGFEAASRGAAQVAMVEQSPQVVRSLHDNVDLLGAAQITIRQGDVLSYLQGPGQPWDIVFLDPPFHQGLVDPVLARLASGGWLHPQSRIYVEAEVELTLNPPLEWTLLRSKQAGEVGYHLFAASDAV